MLLNDGSKNLFRVLKEILRRGRLRAATFDFLVVFVVTAIVLESFLWTAIVVVLLSR
jgi:hypothetical protein